MHQVKEANELFLINKVYRNSPYIPLQYGDLFRVKYLINPLEYNLELDGVAIDVLLGVPVLNYFGRAGGLLVLTEIAWCCLSVTKFKLAVALRGEDL